MSAAIIDQAKVDALLPEILEILENGAGVKSLERSENGWAASALLHVARGLLEGQFDVLAADDARAMVLGAMHLPNTTPGLIAMLTPASDGIDRIRDFLEVQESNERRSRAADAADVTAADPAMERAQALALFPLLRDGVQRALADDEDEQLQALALIDGARVKLEAGMADDAMALVDHALFHCQSVGQDQANVLWGLFVGIKGSLAGDDQPADPVMVSTESSPAPSAARLQTVFNAGALLDSLIGEFRGSKKRMKDQDWEAIDKVASIAMAVNPDLAPTDEELEQLLDEAREAASVYFHDELPRRLADGEPLVAADVGKRIVFA